MATPPHSQAPKPPSHSPRFGLIVTNLGTLTFVLDTLIIRISDANRMDVAILRGLFAFVVTVVGIALFARDTMPIWGHLFPVPTLIFIVLHGTGTVLFRASLGMTSVANVLLISATAPFIAALMSYFVLGERIARMAMYGIIAVFAGVGIIASGSLSGGR